MSPQYQALYLSPHLDDAALSCGGHIHARAMAGEAILIVTLMAGDPPATTGASGYVAALHERWQLAANAAEQRRAEDVVACRILGADYLHLSFPDCIYRGNPPFYQSDADIFGNIHPHEAGVMVTALAEAMTQLPTAAQIIAPLTVGNHVDHQLTRLAAERAFGNALSYYEEFPYVQKTGAVDAIIGNGADWQSIITPLTEANWAAKVESIAAFRSQLSTFFVDKDDIRRQIGENGRLIGGERLWTCKNSG
jgi:LmbE family N-acetylglucosaminyl deacetylase